MYKTNLETFPAYRICTCVYWRQLSSQVPSKDFGNPIACHSPLPMKCPTFKWIRSSTTRLPATNFTKHTAGSCTSKTKEVGRAIESTRIGRIHAWDGDGWLNPSNVAITRQWVDRSR